MICLILTLDFNLRSICRSLFDALVCICVTFSIFFYPTRARAGKDKRSSKIVTIKSCTAQKMMYVFARRPGDNAMHMFRYKLIRVCGR